MKKLITRLTLSLVAPQMILSGAFAQGMVNLKNKLDLREKLYSDFTPGAEGKLVSTPYLTTQRDLNDVAKNEVLKAWYGIKSKELKLKDDKFRKARTQDLSSYVKSQKVIDWAGHYQFTEQYDKTAAVLSSYNYMLHALISELATDPRDDGNMTRVKREAKTMVDSSFAAAEAADKCLFQNAAASGNGMFPSGLATLAQKCLKDMQPYANFVSDAQLNKFFRGSNQTLSLTGLIEGNKVEQILENFYDADFIRYMAPMTHAVINNYGTKGADGKIQTWDVETFKSKMTSEQQALTDFFTPAEGFPENPRDHKVWTAIKPNGKKNIYGEVMNAIDGAQQSLFIDVFFIGGSIGATLAKRIIQKVQTNKDLWVYILNDRNNPLGYNAEMQPVYNYLRAYAEKFPNSRIVLMVPQVDLKRTAFPQIADLLIKDSTIQSALTESQRFGLAGQLSFYPKGKSDHSKVIVVDGLDKSKGIAFVGSKNFTDSSGGVAYDEVTKIQGPAVPAILDSYYQDLKLALQLVGKNTPQYLADLYKNNYKDGVTDMNTQIAKLLSKVDVLNRSKISGVTDLSWPAQGTASLMIGENNAYGTIRTALPQVIAGIRSADNQIIISEQFIYEPSVVRALKEQVDLKLPGNPSFRVYILLADMADHFDAHKEFSHIPNVSFIDEFANNDSKIQVKWKKVPAADFVGLNDVKKSHGLGYAPEYHLKSLSIDGITEAQFKASCGTDAGQASLAAELKKSTKLPLLISGSANKDVMTMTGGFREYQVAVYDQPTTVKHDCQFWSRWTDKDQSVAVDPSTMNLPAKIKELGLNERRFNQLVRDIVNGAYNSVSGYFSN